MNLCMSISANWELIYYIIFSSLYIRYISINYSSFFLELMKFLSIKRVFVVHWSLLSLLAYKTDNNEWCSEQFFKQNFAILISFVLFKAEEERAMRRVSYLKATWGDRLHMDSDVEPDGDPQGLRGYVKFLFKKYL